MTSGKNLQSTLTKEILEYEYNQCRSIIKTANKLNISIDSVTKYLKLYDINYSKSNHPTKYICNENIFNSDTEESFYLAGFLAADGSLYERKYSKIVKIGLSKDDILHLEKLKILFNSTHPIITYKNKYSGVAEIQIVSSIMFESLLRFNIFPNKSLILKFPEWIICHPLKHHFMRGYFDGDGCFTYCGLGKNRIIKQLSFNILGTYDFIYNYQNILISNIDLNRNKISPKSSIFSLTYSGNNVVKKIGDFLYKDASIYLDRKYQKFKEII